ncbi:unnamed protein product [Alternaria burnsii]|nr:unnamed protein product [Alternaria burnsii]
MLHLARSCRHWPRFKPVYRRNGSAVVESDVRAQASYHQRPKDLEPKRGWELLQKLDQDSKKIDNSTFARAFYPKDGIVAAINYVEVPEAGAFVFIGKDPQDDPKYGKPGLDMGDTNFNQYYQKPLADADCEAGKTRFHWWHVDGTYWKYDPPTFTMLRPIKFPNRRLEHADSGVG